MSYLVSVIVPVYNAERTIDDCLKSIINQSYSNIEIILVDDGSSDNSAIICDNYANKNKFMKVIHTSNNGVSSSRNKGIEFATGEYIIFIDSDDTVEKTYISELVSAMQSGNYDIVVCGYYDIYVYTDTKIKNILNKNDFILLKEKLNRDYIFLEKFLLSPWGKLYKKRLIYDKKILFPIDFVITEDQVFNYRYLSQIDKIKFLNKPLYNYYHRKNSSLTNIVSKNFYICDLKNLEMKKVFLKKNKIYYPNEIITESFIRILDKYVVSNKYFLNNYHRFKNEIKKIKNNINISFKNQRIKKKILLFFIKMDMYSPMYLFYKYKYRNKVGENSWGKI